jgi:hypothetical protein
MSIADQMSIANNDTCNKIAEMICKHVAFLFQQELVFKHENHLSYFNETDHYKNILDANYTLFAKLNDMIADNLIPASLAEYIIPVDDIANDIHKYAEDNETLHARLVIKNLNYYLAVIMLWKSIRDNLVIYNNLHMKIMIQMIDSHNTGDEAGLVRFMYNQSAHIDFNTESLLVKYGVY